VNWRRVRSSGFSRSGISVSDRSRGYDLTAPTGFSWKSAASLRERTLLFLVSHSQTINTRQPADRSVRCTRRSRATLAANLVSQNARRAFGVVVRRQPPCRCQKQPWTNTTACRLGSTISGRPGRIRFFGPLIVNRRPSPCRRRRVINSGVVFLWRTRAMSRLRWAGDKGSLALPRRTAEN
jgi:hypothetical protein